MGSRILLLNANRCAAPDPVFPLGLSYLSAALRQAGHECLWLDRLADETRGRAASTSKRDTGGEFAELLRSARPDFAAISLRNIDDVLIRKRETFFDELPALVATVRQNTRSSVILGGSAFSLFPQRLMELAGADFGIIGEGESSLLALIAALTKRESYDRIPGLVFRNQDGLVQNPPEPEPVAWPLAAADRPERLTEHYLRTGSMLNVQTQRGCPQTCCYCTYPLIEGRQHRCRPADMVAEEFEQLQKLGARYVFIVDSVFNSSPQHVTEVCEALLRRKNKLPWGCFLRPQGLTPELMALMSRAGLTHIEFGSDSFCDSVLEAYRKHLTFDDIYQSSELASKANVDFCHFVIAGGPGETPATLDAGFANSQRLHRAVIMAVVGMRIYPGTRLFAQAVAEGRLPADADLLTPAYYLAPGLTSELIFSRLQAFARRAPNWIPGDADAAFLNLVSRLRQRGVAGPLWSYFSTIQRLWPRGFAGAGSSPLDGSVKSASPGALS
ncbi:MAG TPA: lipid biosynthesis B12-binding/radical SAM protein [Verrucomicrobiae bacterium]|nr:lipid biosynthesis B12-binding/radical SAM protein [Verrucomicrobiae bacterium]